CSTAASWRSRWTSNCACTCQAGRCRCSAGGCRRSSCRRSRRYERPCERDRDRKRRSRMKPSERLERIPPYAFAQLERKIASKRAAGMDVISLGIGDPDRPTPALIVEAMQEAVTEPETHRYPSNRG